MPSKQSVPPEWGRRKTRNDPPTLDEAIAAAQCLTDRIEGQIEIASQLMGLPEDEVRQQVLRAAPARSAQTGYKPPVRPQERRTQVVVVERRAPRAMLRRPSP